MSKRRRTHPGQLALWGLYELEAHATASARRPARQASPTVRLMPAFKAATTGITFRAELTTESPSTSTPIGGRGARFARLSGRLQAVTRPKKTGRDRIQREQTSRSETVWTTISAGQDPHMSKVILRAH